MANETTDPQVPSSIQAVLALFESELAELKFPDLDLSILQQAAQGVIKHAETLAHAESALQTARELYHESQELLLQKCQRAVAYARVYADDNVELLQKLESINLPRNTRGRGIPVPAPGIEARPAARRGRRASTPSGPLFLESAPPDEATAALENEAA